MYLLLCFTVTMVLVFTATVSSLKNPRSASEIDLRLQSLIGTRHVKKVEEDISAHNLEKQSSTSFQWAEQWFHGTEFARDCRTLLLQSGTNWSSGGFIFSSALLAIVPSLFLFTATRNPFLSIASIGLAAVPYGWLRFKRTRRVAAFERMLPQALEMFARSLRAGHSVAIAISTLAEEAPEPARSQFVEVYRDQNYGLPLRDALLSMVERMPSRDLRVFVTGVLVQKDTGGNLPEIMDRIVAVLRDRVRIQGEVRTHTAQGRLTGWILCLLPPVLLLLINLMNPGYSRLLFTDTMGRKLLYTGVGLLVVGALSIRHIIRAIEV